jgi:hypothetical protein
MLMLTDILWRLMRGCSHIQNGPCQEAGFTGGWLDCQAGEDWDIRTHS